MTVNTTQPDQFTWVIGLSGKLNFHSRQAFHKAVQQAEHTSPRQIIFDLTEISSIDSAGLGLLALTHKRLTTAGIRIGLTNLQHMVKDVFQLTNLDNLFCIYDSVATASQSLKTAVQSPTATPS